MHALSDMAPAIETAANALQAFMIPAKELSGTGERFFSSQTFSKTLIGMAYAFEIVRIAATTAFALIKLQGKNLLSHIELFNTQIVVLFGGAFLKVQNFFLPLINTIIKGINRIKSTPIKLVEKKEINMMGELSEASRKHADQLIKLWNAQKKITIEYRKQNKLAEETLEIRATAFLKAEVQKPPTGMLGQLGGETTEERKPGEEADAKIEAVLRYQSVFMEAYELMTNSVVALREEEKKSNKQKIDGALTTSQAMIHSMKGFNKSWFEASKALSIAETIMTTYAAMTKALLIQPPPVGIAFASTIGALGFANVARIKAQKYEGKAEGGSVRAGQSYIVGERGMEMFTPNQSGNITPNNALGGTTNINFNISANDTRGFDQLLQNRRGMIVSMINRAVNEQGRRSII